jgi:hypothetical protein
LIALLLICFATASAYRIISPPPVRGAVSPDIVISQVYGGGGNSGATFTHDFIELFNRGNTTINLSGWAVQYASSTGASWQKTDLGGMLAPGKYYLIQQSSGGASGAPLPTPDAVGSISMAATAGKVVLTNTNTLIASGVPCPSGSSVVDIVGYGSGTNCFEGAGPTPSLSSTTAALRAGNGCTETDNNASDFAAGAVNPRNTSLPAVVCGSQTNPTGVGAANPNPVAAGNVVLLTVTVTPGTNPPSTGITVTGNLSPIGGAASQQFFDDGTNGDDDDGDNVFSFRIQVGPSVTPGAKTLTINIADSQSRSSAATINLTVQPPPPLGNVVISQIFGGGGNIGAPFTHDFIELYNRSNAPVNITGWSVQYASSAGASWQKVDLGGTLAPGQYYLIQLASGGANGMPLPTPDASGSISMASTAGKVALTSNATLLNSSCPIGPGVVDFVGYGSNANCFEGSGPTPSPSSERAAIRFGLGCADSNDNAADFVTNTPMPKNISSPVNVCGEGSKFENLTVKITDAAACTAAGNILIIEARFTNTGTRAQTDNAGSELIAELPPAMIALDNTCTATSGNCAITSALQVDWNGVVRINETIVIKFLAQVRDGVQPGTIPCVNAKLNFDSDGDGINNAMVAKTECVAVNCAAAGPGAPNPAQSEISDQKPGSVLIYPIYSSMMASPSRENARISITNTDPTRSVAVHLFFIEDDSSSVADTFVCLTPNQTASFLASDFDPDVTGYLIAIAVDQRTGCPINFNHLIGDEYVKLSTGHAANLAAEAFAALTGAPPICSDTTTTVDINFDGISYNAAPRALAADNIPSLVDGNSTLLVIDRIGGNLATGVSTIGQIFGIAYDDMEHSFSFEQSTSRRQFRMILSNTFPRTTPRLSSIIPSGRTGWLKFWRSSDGGIIGAVINFNPNAAANASAFNQGHNLHHLKLTTEASFNMPVFPPSC